VIGLFGGAFFIVALLLAASIAVGFGFLRMIGMYLDREISLGELVIWTFAYLAAFAITIATLNWLFALMTLALTLVGPVTSYLANWRGLRQMRERDIANYLQMAKERPEIPYPHEKLGDIFFASSDYGLATHHYRAYLKTMKSGRIKARLEQCERYQRIKETQARICPKCGAENPSFVTHCIQCGEPQPGLWEILEQFRGRKGYSALLWLGGGSMGLALILSFLGVLHPIYAAGLYVIAFCGLFVYVYLRVSTS